MQLDNKNRKGEHSLVKPGGMLIINKVGKVWVESREYDAEVIFGPARTGKTIGLIRPK